MRLSLSGGSGLPISVLLDCPRKFQLIREGWKRRFTPDYFVDGQVFHYAAEKIINGDSDCLKSVKDVQGFCNGIYDTGTFYDELREKEVRFDHTALKYPKKILKSTGKPSTVTKAQNSKDMMLQLLLQLYLSKAAGAFDTVTDTEVLVETAYEGIATPLIDPVTGAPDEGCLKLAEEGIIFCGRLDIESDGPTKASDLKTTKQDLGRLCKVYQQQFSLYAYLKTLKDGVPLDKFGVHGFKKCVTKSDYQYEEMEVKMSDYTTIFNMLKYTGELFLQCEKMGYAKTGFMSSGCKDKFSQLCPYHCICFPSKHTDAEKATLIKEEKE